MVCEALYRVVFVLTALLWTGAALPINPCLSNPTWKTAFFTDATNCTNYYVCNSQQLTARLSCHSGEAFDSAKKSCVPRATVWDLCGDPSPLKHPCLNNKQNKLLVTSETNCTEYHICWKRFHVVKMACASTDYHFNDHIRACVIKGSRFDICKNEITTTIAPTTRRRIPLQTVPPVNPCRRASNGHAYYVTDSADCSRYHLCVDKVWRAVLDCGHDRMVFNEEFHVCVLRGGPRDICKNEITTTIAPTTRRRIPLQTVPPVNPCRRASNGHAYYVTDSADCSRYHLCVDKVWRAVLDCGHDRMVFNEDFHVCVLRGGPRDICTAKTSTMITTPPTQPPSTKILPNPEQPDAGATKLPISQPCANNTRDKLFLTSKTNCTEYHVCLKREHTVTVACASTDYHYNDELYACVLKGSRFDICKS